MQGKGIDAEPLARRGRAVVKDVSQVGIAAVAGDFHARHSVAVVGVGLQGLFIRGLRETRPPRPGFKLVFRAEQGVLTTNAMIRPFGFMVVVGATEGRLGSLLAGHGILFRGELLFPFILGFVNFLSHVPSPRPSPGRRGRR